MCLISDKPVSSRAGAVLGVLLILSGCEQSGSSAPAFEVRDSAGTEIVLSRESQWPDVETLRLGEDPVVQIGGAGATADPYILTHVRALSRLSEGRIVLVDGLTQEIRWYDTAGHHIATRGGEGRGPGEFTSASALVRMGGDSVAVQNMPVFKQVIFGPDASYARDNSIDNARLRALGRWTECANRLLPDRSMLLCQADPAYPSPDPERPGHFRSYSRYFRVPLELDTAYALGLYGGIEQWGVDLGGGRIRYAMHPFSATTVVAAADSPVVVAIARNPAYSIEVWSGEGKLERIIRRVRPRQIPSAAERAEAREQMRKFGFADEAAFNRLMAQFQEPDSLPAVQGLVWGPAGELWVKVHSGRSSQPSEYEVFEGGGRLATSVQVPSGFSILEVGEDYVLGVSTDADRVPTVQLFRLFREQQ